MADIILFAGIGIFAIIGYRKGLVRSVVGIVSLAASVVLAWALYPLISDLLVANGVDLTMTERIRESILAYVGGGGETEMLPTGIKMAVESGREELISAAAENAAQVVLNIITFISVLITSRIIIFIGIRALHIISRLPGINLVNRTSGLLLGILEGIAVAYIALTIIYAAIPIESRSVAYNVIKDSTVANIMYENNPIVDLLMPDKADYID